MSFLQLGYQYIRPLYPSDRQAVGGTRSGAAELSPAGTLSNVLSSMYAAPYAAAAAAQAYGAFLPYTTELPIFPQLVRAPTSFYLLLSCLTSLLLLHYYRYTEVYVYTLCIISIRHTRVTA